MRFHVDVQIHSKYSRATSRNADIDNLALWGRKKGVTVVGTGDFTHPAWLAEIKEKLVPAEPGLFRLRPDLEQAVHDLTPAACAGQPVRFMLEVEISTIYKRDDKVRKVHHLIFVPDLEAADRLVAALSRIGNLESDGRPILGLDSRDLLEITLETGPHSYLIPAHIWTPWFAVLGSKSGFDSVDACYVDLAEHIFAVETGLSSDPAMNWRISGLDRFRLVSNSDAHSPPKIGREATTYDTDLDYFAILRALRSGEGFVGTVEFFPEEGKYHMDGHRKCGVCLTPEETKAHGERCPVCGGPLTVGVLHRIDSLADRTPAEAEANPPPKAGAVSSLVPLPEILSEIHRVGVGSKRVAQDYERLLGALGTEMAILETIPTEDIARVHSPLLAEGIARLRSGQVIRQSGYDGEYGVIRLFEDDELSQETRGAFLFDLPPAEAPRAAKPANGAAALPNGHGAEPPAAPSAPEERRVAAPQDDGSPLGGLDPDQRAAAETVDGPLLILAGPGSGKTRTLTRRIAHLIAAHDVPPEACLAVTFTRRAAAEMRERLEALLPEAGGAVPVHTFHSLGLSLLRERPDSVGLAADFNILDEAARRQLLIDGLSLSARKAGTLLRALSKAKRTGQAGDEETAQALASYDAALRERNAVDFDDLVRLALQALETNADFAGQVRERYRWISVDEFQDLDAQQYRLMRALAPEEESNLCVIGDPDQAIYGFRGADAEGFARFEADYPAARTVRLARNYRSSGTIVSASAQMLGRDGMAPAMVRDMADRITVHTARSDRAEAEFVVHTIEQMLGGHSFFSIDSGRADASGGRDVSFSDFAVLYRTDAQSALLSEAFERSGMPFQKHGHKRLAEAPWVERLLAALPDDGGAAALAERLQAAADSLAGEAGADADPSDAAGLATALRHLRTLARATGDDPAAFADGLALAAEADLWDARADRVSLLTLHAAKGLEFPVVFIVGLEGGILPLTWGAADDAALEEERRLFYVGMTRAQDRLILSRAEKRHWRGKQRELPVSPYLAQIEAALVETSRSGAKARGPSVQQLDLF